MKHFDFTIEDFKYEKWLIFYEEFCGKRIFKTKDIDCFYIAPSESSDMMFDVYIKTWFGHSALRWETESKEEIKSAFKKLCKEMIKVEPQFKVYNHHCINFKNIEEIKSITDIDKPRIRLNFGIGGVEFENATEQDIQGIKKEFKQYCSDNQIKLNETNL